MPGPWDSEIKKLVGEIPQDLVTWLFYGATFVQEASSHLKNRNVDADLLYHVLVDDRPYMFHVEFQSSHDPTMAERLWEYNVLASLANKLPVHSFLIYLKDEKTEQKQENSNKIEKKSKKFVESPFIQLSAFGEEIHHFTFKVVKMWEIPTDVLLYSGHKGLLPLVPLTREGLRHEAIEQAITQLKPVKEQSDIELLASLYSLGSLAYNKGDNLIWFQRRFHLVDSILKDSWLYKEWAQRVQEGRIEGRQEGRVEGRQEGRVEGRQEGRVEGRQEGQLEGMQQNVVALVRHRFDSLAMLAQERIVLLTTPEQIQNLLFQIAGAQNEQEAQRYLLEIKSEQTH